MRWPVAQGLLTCPQVVQGAGGDKPRFTTPPSNQGGPCARIFCTKISGQTYSREKNEQL